MTVTSSNFELARTCAESSIYIMGSSFVIGSLFTILVLLLLDFMRRNSNKDAAGS